jgi:hypothetical protein
MASELRVNTLKDASGNNSVAVSTVFDGTAKAYANNDSVSSNLKSFNVASFTDAGTGLPEFNFTSAMSDANSVVVACADTGGAHVRVNDTQTTTAKYRVQLLNLSDTVADADSYTAILGDLA